MEVILKFNLPDDTYEHATAINGGILSSIICDLDNKLRGYVKYGGTDIEMNEITEDEQNTYYKCRELLRDIMADHGINFEHQIFN